MAKIYDFTKHQQAKCLEMQRRANQKPHRSSQDRPMDVENFWRILYAAIIENPMAFKSPAESSSTMNLPSEGESSSPKKSPTEFGTNTSDSET